MNPLPARVAATLLAVFIVVAAALSAVVMATDSDGISVLGALALVALALAVAWALAREVFDFSWHLPWWSVPLGGLLAAATAVGVGQLTLRGVLRQSVTQTLRQSET